MESNIKKLEYISLDKIDYDYVIQELIFNVNKFELSEEIKESNEKKKKKENKDGKKKKKDDLDLSKQSSKLSIYSIKPDKKKADKKDKGKEKNPKCIKNVNIILDKIKTTIVNKPLEEIIDTTSKNTINDKKQKKKNEKNKQVETPQDKVEKDNLQNKKVEELLKTFKEKKQTKGMKMEEKQYIRNSYLSSHKYMFVLDPTQKLKLRDLFTFNQDAINAFFNIMIDIFNTFTEDDEYRKQNIKEATTIFDNLCEISIDTNLLPVLIEKEVQYLYELYNKGQIYKQYIINTLYSIIKYQNDFTISNINYLYSLYNNIQKELDTYLDNPINNIREDENINYYLFVISLLQIIISKYDNTQISNFIKSMNKLIVKLKTDDNDDYESFTIVFNNLKFFTKFYYLFDYHKNKINVLSMKISKSIENSLLDIQNLIVKEHSIFFLRSINNIVFKYLNNFDIYYNNNETIYDEVFHLMKYIIEDKTFDFSIINLYDTCNDLSLSDLNFPSDDYISKYIILIVKYLKYFEKAFIKNDEKELDMFLDYFHNVLFKIVSLKIVYIKEKYEKIIEKLIEPYINDEKLTLKIIKYIRSFIINNLLSKNSNILKNIKYTKDLIKFYSNSILIKKNFLSHLNLQDINNHFYSLLIIFYLNFFNLNKEADLNLLIGIMKDSDSLVFNLLYINKKMCSHYMKNYINEELIVTEKVINTLFETLNKDNSIISLDKLVKYIIDSFEDKNIVKISNSIYILEKLINKNLVELKKLEEILFVISKKKEDAIINNSLVFVMISLILKNGGENIINTFCTETSPNKNIDIIKEISSVNDKIKIYKDENVIKYIDEVLPTFLQVINLSIILKNDPNYFLVDNIEIESIDENNIIKKDHSDFINLRIILNIFNDYLDLIQILLKDNNKDVVLFNISIMQEIINYILSNDSIFKNLVRERNSLEAFIKKYINLKDISYEIDNKYSIEFKNLDEDKEMLSKYGIISELAERISINCADFMKYRCKDQIVHLFKEVDIFKLFLTKDKEFLKILYSQISMNYQTTILDTQNLSTLLSKIQNEDIDYSEEVIYSIFSKQVINYLEFPEELIEFLSTMNDALRYDFNIERKEFYNSLFSYFYIWKAIMSKIENGFKLYTTDKQHVGTIDNYKILLKFIVNYLEKNNRLYEMFMLLSISLIHLIDDEKMLENGLNEEIDEEHGEFDKFIFQFLLNSFYKFVKIFPTLVKYYYDESKSKIKNTIKYLISHTILPKILTDIKSRLNNNNALLRKNEIRVKDTKSLNYIEIEYIAHEEIKFLIEIKIPSIFPLKKLDINIKSNALLNNDKMLNIKMNLNHTLNSSTDNIVDNLIIWGEDVKQLIIIGNEPCPVCYFYLHTTDKSLPNLVCKTCKKKFHSLCIKEWFKNLRKNNQNTSCPMCRSEWTINR